MRKLLNNPVFVAAVALVAVVLIGWKYLPGNRGTPVPYPAFEAGDGEFPVGESAEPVPRLAVAEALRALGPAVAGRDPFALPPKPVVEAEAPAGAPTEIVERLRVSAIWVQGTAVFLLANGRICRPGDSIDRFTVESAAIDGAWISHPAGRSFVPVGGECAVKSTVPSVSVPLSP